MTGQYEYKYVRIKVKMGFWGNFSTAYQEEIARHAREGWRFVQAFAPATQAFGNCDLIFERPLR